MKTKQLSLVVLILAILYFIAMLFGNPVAIAIAAAVLGLSFGTLIRKTV